MAKTCTLPLSALISEPFLLKYSDSVTVKVSATNAYGTSDYSADGVGALIQYPPDAPLQLANDASVTSATKIKLLWVDGVENGGTTVIDYKIMYD